MKRIENLIPTSYFTENDYFESLLISVRVAEPDQVVEVVCRHVDLNKVLAYNRNRLISDHDRNEYWKRKNIEFHRISFRGALRVERKNTSYRHGFLGFDAHSLNFGPRSTLQTAISGILVKQDGSNLSAVVHCSELGNYCFAFEEVSVDVIMCRTVTVGPERWKYYDVETGRRVDPTQPFGNASL